MPRGKQAFTTKSAAVLFNAILTHTCASDVTEDGIRTFRIETHCVDWTILARPNADGEYEIIAATAEDN